MTSASRRGNGLVMQNLTGGHQIFQVTCVGCTLVRLQAGSKELPLAAKGTCLATLLSSHPRLLAPVWVQHCQLPCASRSVVHLPPAFTTQGNSLMQTWHCQGIPNELPR